MLSSECSAALGMGLCIQALAVTPWLLTHTPISQVRLGNSAFPCLPFFLAPFSVACRLSVSPEDPHHRTQEPLSGKSGVSRQSGRFLFSFSTSVECHPSPPQSAFFSCTPFPIPHPLAPAPAMHQVLCCSYQGSFSGGVDPLSQEGPPEHLAAWSKDSLATLRSPPQPHCSVLPLYTLGTHRKPGTARTN